MKMMKGLLCFAIIVMLLGGAGWIGTHFSLSAIWSFLSNNIVGILTGMVSLLIFWLLGTLIEKVYPSKKEGIPSKKKSIPTPPKK